MTLLSSCISDDYATDVYLAGNTDAGVNQYGLGPSERLTSSAMKQDTVSYWDDNGVQGEPSIVLNLTEQRAYFYKGRHLVGVSKVSSGTEGLETPTGTFKVTQKDIDHQSNLFGDYVYPDGTIAKRDIAVGKDPKPPGTVFDGADMHYFMRFVNGIGLHVGYLPGYAASHGCVRMPAPMAKKFYTNVEKGTKVTVVR
ncbi:MAG: L,D-transpeptidase family protein [Verrucomicrobiota bacterium]